MPKVSIVITTWRRFKNIHTILKAWVAEPEVAEVIVFDNSGRFIAPHPDGVKVINSQHNFGSQAGFMSGNFTSSEYVMVVNDDILPQPGFTARMFEWLEKVRSPASRAHALLSVHGRTLRGGTYKSALNPIHRGDLVEAPVRVDYIGQVYFGHRSNFTFDLGGACDPRLDDIDWNAKLRRQKEGQNVTFWVVPNALYTRGEDCNDKYSISRLQGFWSIREQYVKENSDVFGS